MRTHIAAALAALLPAACFGAPDRDPGAAPSGRYTVDPGHTSVIWSVSHQGFSNYVGRFDAIEGALTWNADDPASSALEISIRADSLGVTPPPWEPDFAEEIATKALDADDNPIITFTSTSIEVTGENQGRVTGDLAFAGVTRPVTLDVTFNGSATTPSARGKRVMGFSAQSALDRTEWGRDVWTQFNVGAQVALRIEAEFVRAD